MMEKLEQESTEFYEDMLAKVELVESEAITPFRIKQIPREELIVKLMGKKSGLFEDLQHQHQISVRQTLADMIRFIWKLPPNSPEPLISISSKEIILEWYDGIGIVVSFGIKSGV